MDGKERTAIAKVMNHLGIPLTNEKYFALIKRLTIVHPPDIIAMADSIDTVKCYKMYNGKRVKINDIPITQMIDRDRAMCYPHHWEIAE